jgi:hypothetical protein
MDSPRTARARLAAHVRNGAGPQRITEARRNLDVANRVACAERQINADPPLPDEALEHIKRVVDAAPRPTSERLERLALLLHPGEGAA